VQGWRCVFTKASKSGQAGVGIFIVFTRSAPETFIPEEMSLCRHINPLFIIKKCGMIFGFPHYYSLHTS